MSALNWIREKAAATIDEPIEVDGVTYSVERLFFAGRLPRRMISEICRTEMRCDEFRNETININTRNDRVEYCLTTYTAAA